VAESSWPAIDALRPIAVPESADSDTPGMTGYSSAQRVSLDLPDMNRAELDALAFDRGPAELRTVALDLAPTAVRAVAIVSPLPLAPRPAPLRVDLPAMPTTAPSSMGLSNAGLGGSTPAVLVGLNLLASWRALWLLAKVRPAGICLPSLAPPG
jgi:hypothetical protein